MRSSPETADLFSPATTKIKLLNHSIVVAVLLTSQWIVKSDKPAIAAQFFSRINQILETEKVESDKKVIAELINKHFPDWRRVLNELSEILSIGGIIDSGILVTFSDVSV